jgi:hypothetical protein
MPEFAIVPIREAQASTIAGRQEDSYKSISVISGRSRKGRLASFTLGSMKILSPSDDGLLQQPRPEISS